MQAGISEQAMEPPGECRNIVTLWHEIAKRMGFGEQIPMEERGRHAELPPRARRRDLGRCRRHRSGTQPEQGPGRRYARTPVSQERALLPPSGKVELYSSTLESFGFDPLPYYREAAEPNDEYPIDAVCRLVG